tara:strand:- start:449 stop:667 length:219 start_codon:yes stop_codon:yes gene_type:complete
MDERFTRYDLAKLKAQVKEGTLCKIPIEQYSPSHYKEFLRRKKEEATVTKYEQEDALEEKKIEIKKFTDYFI